MKERKGKKLILIVAIIILLLLTLLFTAKINKKENTNKKEENKIVHVETIEEKLAKNKHYKKENEQRYIKYMEINKDMNLEDAIIYVNMGIDQPYYTNIKQSDKLNEFTILVNKYIALPSDYIPNNLENIDLKYSRSGMRLVKEARNAFEKLSQDARLENYKILAMSSYRSYQYQVNLYKRYELQDGREQADTYSARPGHSEHQSGLAVDVWNGNLPYTDFEKTKEFNWMQENAYKYGFILRFPKDKENETGYKYEPWHYRYVGQEAAEFIHKNNISLEYYVEKYL